MNPNPSSSLPFTDPRRLYLPLLLGIALTLITRGYDFASGNHAIYLVAPLREAYPNLLANDWWTTHTLQYHLIFTKISAWLIRADLIAPAFILIQLALIAALHIAWHKLVRALGWGTREYLLSVILYYLSAGGLSLGSYRFIQEASVLPANIANIAMLWGIVYWIEGKCWPAAIGFGVAGLFHLNHAIIATAFWGVSVVQTAAASLRITRQRNALWGRHSCLPERTLPNGTLPSEFGKHPLTHGAEHGDPIAAPESAPSNVRPLSSTLIHPLLGLLLILTLSLPNLHPAARAILTPHASMRQTEFVDLYVKLRHPHHYDPLSWPIALWISFLWPIILIAAWRLRTLRGVSVTPRGAGISPASPLDPPCSLANAAATAAPQSNSPGAMPLSAPAPAIIANHRRALFAFRFFMLLLLIAFLFAGVFYVSEPLIQMSLFRFSIYPKLLSCIAAAGLLLGQVGKAQRAVRILLIGLIGLLYGIIPLCLMGVFGATVIRFAFDNLLPIGTAALMLIGAIKWVLLVETGHRTQMRLATFFACVALLASAALSACERRIPGLNLAVEDHGDADYLALCHWSRDHTPSDAIFLVPPAEQHMRYQGQRAIVINFKGVPQLSSELGEWRTRLQTIIDMPLANLPRRFDLIHAALSRRYDELSVTHLSDIARRYRARYLVLSKKRSDPTAPANARIVFENPRYQLYDLAP